MSLIVGVLATKLVVVSFLLLATNVVSQDTSQDQDKDVFIPKVGGLTNAIVCQGTKYDLRCANSSMLLVINSATYGREELGKIICPYDSKFEKEDKDDKTKCKEDVKPKVKELCHKRKACQLSATKEVFGSPCKGIYKYLLVIYACGLPVYVPKNVTTVNVTKPPNVTQSNTTVPPTTSTYNRTMRLNSSCTTSYAITPEPVTSVVPLLPSTSTVAKTVNDDKQRSSTNNSSSYIAVFVITSVCAAIIIGGVFARCWYLRRRTKSQNFAVLHKPKRFFDPPPQFKQSNGHVSRRPSHDINMNDDLLADRSLTKRSDLVFTKADIESTPRHKHQNQGLASKDEADALKGDNSTFYVNPIYDKNRQGSTASGGSTPSSHPRTQAGPHRLSNASDSKTGVLGSPARTLNKQQLRCNSMGNIPRSSHSSMQRRHPSAGNVASNKDVYQYPQQQSLLYNAPQIKAGNYQGQGQGNYQGQGGYQGQPRGPINQSPARQGVGPHPSKNPMNQKVNAPQQGSPTKTPQRNRPSGPGGSTSYPAPGHQGRRGNRPNSPYEYGSTEKDSLMDGQRYPGSNDPNTIRHHGNAPGEIGITVNPAANSQVGPMQYRSNGPMPSREGQQPFDPAGNHIKQLDDVSGYGKIRSKQPADTLSPLDVTHADSRFLGAPNSDSHSSRVVEGSRPQIQYPAPPDPGSDSSEDDLYSIVAKGNYDSVINDPLNVQQVFRPERKKHRNPPGNTSRTSSRNYVSGRDTSV
ncbi:uncharacterized protein LOC116295804 isoform X2 [Actinia tenebrosa]|uniref:Uncharacterized protein LOC116295804 isoform X2 n=1 Tax=Actinia tenebrosa TaxID=6105 RepID=A0A6P8HW55_ACTTE|nr:uncharacterized protein LOC116295804 isoform X2 [Actinia tenebrosa]